MLSVRLRELRNEKGLTQVAIAELLKITRGAYSMYESDRRQMNHESLCILADYYGVSADYLLGRKAKEDEPLSNDEKMILRKYRHLDERGQENIKVIIEIEYSRNKKGTKKAAT